MKQSILRLCKAYSNYVAEKKKQREGVPRHRTITIEEIQSADDMWTINEPMYWSINIYGSYDDYFRIWKPFTLEQRYLNAICWYFAEVNNGGHSSIFYITQQALYGKMLLLAYASSRWMS